MDYLYIPHYKSASSPTQLHPRIQASFSESPKAPSRHLLSNSPHNEYSTFYTATQLYSTKYSAQLNFTQETSGISPKSSCPLSHLKQGSVSRHCVDAHTAQSVQPQGLTSRRKAEEKNKTGIDRIQDC